MQRRELAQHGFPSAFGSTKGQQVAGNRVFGMRLGLKQEKQKPRRVTRRE